jgi:hypothetical protein
MQADTLASAGDEDRGRGHSHERLASRVEQNYTSAVRGSPIPAAVAGAGLAAMNGNAA